MLDDIYNFCSAYLSCKAALSVLYTFMNLHGFCSVRVSTYLRSQIGKSQLKFYWAENDKSTCTADKQRRKILWTKKRRQI